MGRKIRSARGEMVDLDLLKIKEQIAAAPAPIDVQRRSDFIERKMRRRLKKATMETVDTLDVEPNLPNEHGFDDEDIDDTELMPASVVDGSEALAAIDTTPTTVEEPAKRTVKQRARREQ